MEKNEAENNLKYLFFSILTKTGWYFLQLTPQETIFMKCQILFSGQIYIYIYIIIIIIILSSAELARRVGNEAWYSWRINWDPGIPSTGLIISIVSLIDIFIKIVQGQMLNNGTSWVNHKWRLRICEQQKHKSHCAKRKCIVELLFFFFFIFLLHFDLFYMSKW